jgi:hypothetical protein
MHFLMSCSKYDKTRQDLFSIVGMTCINIQNLSIEEIFLWLMTCENDLVFHSAKGHQGVVLKKM